MDAPAPSSKTATQPTAARNGADGVQFSARQNGDARQNNSVHRAAVSKDASSTFAAAAKPNVKPTLKPLDIIVPAEIGRYTIGEKIGSGTLGSNKCLSAQIKVSRMST